MLFPCNCQYYCGFLLANMYAVINKLSHVAYEVLCNVSQINPLLNANKCLLKNFKLCLPELCLKGFIFQDFRH